MTKAHNDRILRDDADNGYSIRVGKKLPQNSANLAYVHSPKISPEDNLMVTDLSDRIRENGLPTTYKKEKMMFPDDSFLLRELSGESRLPSKKIALTDEFSIPTTSQDKPSPLYYMAKTKHWFDAKGATSSPYQGEYLESPPERIVDYAELTAEEREEILYLGDKIRITNLDGTALKTGLKYKVKLVQETGDGVPENAYGVYIYTNFRNSKNETYVIRYEKYNANGTHEGDTVEVLNAYPFFAEVPEDQFSELQELASNPKLNGEWRDELFNQEYAIVEAENNTYQVYAPSQVAIANNETRPAHQFKYRVSADLKTKYSQANPGTINIGIAYLNNSIFNVENLTGTLKKLYEDDYKPAYLDMVNPHNEQLSYVKENSRYWLVDLSMPAEHYDDYDLIILTGYGFYDMSLHNDAIRRYLQNGGKIWVDNAGTGDQVLSFTAQDGRETFITNVGFSKTQNETGFKVAGAGEKAVDFVGRLYLLNSSNLKIGYESDTVKVNPKITFGSGEAITKWQRIVDYSTTNPSVIYRKIEDKGEILVSNCGVFRSLFFSDDDATDTKFTINTILTFAESKRVITPWLSEYTYHRDNLFREEYSGTGDDTYYVDDRSDMDASQIVAKKVIKRATREALLPYLPKAFYTAKGVYEVDVESDNEVMITNNSLESGAFNASTNAAITTWTATTATAIPGWGVTHQAGSTPEFKHITSYSQRGAKAIQIKGNDDGVGAHAYWSHKTRQLPGGSYKVTTWVRASQVKSISDSVSPIAVYDLAGSRIATGSVILGNRDWVKIEVNFTLQTAKQVEIRLGFTNGNGAGTLVFDFVSLYSVGSVYESPNNDGSLPLYFYAVTPRGDSFDLKSLGFKNGDITTYDPEIDVTYTIRAFVYTWDNVLGRYMREYGNFVTETRTIRRSDGIISLGTLTTMLPPLDDGAQWADMNKIYYEVFVGAAAGADDDSKFVNLAVYNTETGKYYFNKSGEIIVRYRDIYNERIDGRNLIVQATTGYYTIRATKRRYGLKVESDDQIRIEYPSTIDNRDCWFLRIRNGAFTKHELGYNELLDLKMYDARYYEFQQRLFGTHYYAIPEYKRQVFKPQMGIKRVRKEIAEYVNDNTIRVQNSPLHVKSGSVKGEQLDPFDVEGKVFKGNNNGWIQSAANPVKVYVDENMDGNYVEWDGYLFDIDYVNGYVVFDGPVNGNVKADYAFNNLTVFKRRYNNIRVKNEVLVNTDDVLVTTDKKTFSSRHQNWLEFPSPVVKMFPYGKTEPSIVPVDAYTIDYEAGQVIFNEDIHDRVVVDYHYSTDTELKIKDFDAQNGLIYLANGIDFKDEVYVNYYYEENYLEYRGYYDELAGRFIHLDLNPSEGHYSTIPVAREDSTTNTMRPYYEEVPTSKLMNKEIYVYIVPVKNSFGLKNEHTVRHCYSLVEWRKIQKINPTALLLGIVHPREVTTVKDVTVMDARTRGGGLREDISLNQIEKTQPLSTNHWDMGTWDGKSYYKNGVLIIELPKKILQNEGGQFTEKEVTDIVRKYIAYGIYYIIEFV
jgi:hypothetical protein